MYVSLLYDGSGTDDDPYRVDLPVYIEVQPSLDHTSAIVSPGPRCNPPQTPPPNSPLWQTINGYRTLIGLDPIQLAAWYALLNRLYPRDDHYWSPAFP